MSTLSLKMADELYAEVKLTSKSLGVNTSEFVRDSIKLRLAKHKAEQSEKSLIKAGEFLAKNPLSKEDVMWLSACTPLKDEMVWWNEDV